MEQTDHYETPLTPDQQERLGQRVQELLSKRPEQLWHILQHYGLIEHCGYDVDEACAQGWAIFYRSDGREEVQRIDERDDGIEELPNDEVALGYAKAMGVRFLSDDGFLLTP